MLEDLRHIQLKRNWLACGLAFACCGFFVGAAAASTMIDPDPTPEPGSTLFGYAVAVAGDVNGDSVPDLVVGAPFQDGDFANPIPRFGDPQNVGKAWLIDGANLTVIRVLDDPKFQVANTLKFGGEFGSSVAALGDINGDGVPDVLIGVPHHNVEDQSAGTEEINVGRAFAFSGSDGTILLTIESPSGTEGDRFGFAVAGLGDVNGDGVPDFVVGIPKKDAADGTPDVGGAYIFSGADGSQLSELDAPARGGLEANGRAGTALANAGDIDNDGKSDVLVGAPGNSRAFIYSGATGSLIRTILSPAKENVPSFGFALDGGKDLNGDGTPDVVIGAPNQKRLTGIVYAFDGSTGALLRKITTRVGAFAKFGASVKLINDVTGDHSPDILVGAPDVAVNGAANAGQVFIYNGRNGRLFRAIASAQPTAYSGFGFAAAAADFDNDGALELVTGAPYQDINLVIDGDTNTYLQMGQIEIQEIQ